MIDSSTVLFVLGSFVVGYLVGRVDVILNLILSNRFSSKLRKSRNVKTESAAVSQTTFSRKPVAQAAAANKITPVDDIDTRVYVTPVATGNLTKTNDAKLGKTSTTDDNINQSVSKLAQLKGQ